ncbi:2-C-methyl-D-erythritol 4-phosphate cytidylyltransferase [Candidatus Micrarchaeota archaeon]|nr:2-C-methyl-D-erythritol 4-phosphate cytidylyltransferase [Candidatus Micrarchaeota archaeon]MBU2477068.1 2-C-methyl-D-erythritol 4-phosphate cytidylyltransferase [Candidatus Micrarchaeota archaeon]
MNYALICAGGKGKRMEHEKNKVFMKIKGKEIIARTLEVFEKTEEVQGIVISTSMEDFAEMEKIITREGCKKVEAIVEGGKERQDSVYNGLKKLKEIAGKEDIVLIHNAANPFVKKETISRCIKEAREFGASVAAQKVKDTIKKVNEDLLVKETLNRKELWQMQTPQAIIFHIALKAFEKAFEEKFYGTDDVQLVERIHGKVKIVECSYENIKITTQEDIELAEKIIEKRKTE